MNNAKPLTVPLASLVVLVTAGCPCSVETYPYQDFALTNVCTHDDNWCGYADPLGKAILYGEMSMVVEVPRSCDKLDITIFIPANGYGEGLAGPAGSSVHIIVNGVIREEAINDAMPYHHGAYYRYEYGDSFTNTFNVLGESEVELIIRANGGARMDFEAARLMFWGN